MICVKIFNFKNTKCEFEKLKAREEYLFYFIFTSTTFNFILFISFVSQLGDAHHEKFA